MNTNLVEYPRLRPTISAFPVEHQGQQMICLQDPERLTDQTILLPQAAAVLLAYFNGQNSVLDIQAACMRRFGEMVDSDVIKQLISQLDDHYLLVSDRYAAKREEFDRGYREAAERPAAHAGQAYHDDPEKLRYQLTSFFTGRDGPAAFPEAAAARGEVRGIIVPHIDLRFGGPCYAWAYKELAEAERPDLFIIFGTCHSLMRNYFALTRKHFQTPLGAVETDGDFVDALLAANGDDLLDDELAHRLEHTIEFQTIFLQHLFGDSGPVRIVPILCSSFDLLPDGHRSPWEVPNIRRFLEQLRAAIAASGKRVCLVASVDLCHIGQRYGDQQPPTEAEMRDMAETDVRLLQHAENLDAEAFFSAVLPNQDRLRICGLAPIYSFLRTIDASRGRLLKHSYIKQTEANGGSTVSYCSMSFA